MANYGMFNAVHQYLERETGRTTRTRKRHSPGEGSVWAYKTKAGQERYAIGYVLQLPGRCRPQRHPAPRTAWREADPAG